MSDAATRDKTAGSSRKHAYFATLVLVSLAITWRVLSALALYSFRDESCSHILLVPLISLFLVYKSRTQTFLENRGSVGLGLALIALGLLAFWQANRHSFAQEGKLFLSEASIAVVAIWIGGFALCYGSRAMRAALFPLLFLLLMVPLPDAILARVIHLLQEGSTETAFLIFKAVGVPVFRQGFVLSLPTVTIEVASECSSIRSSVALLITCILAAHFLLRTTWRSWLFAALVIPLSVIKNGIRIATLTLLSIYVDPRFLTGSLHRKGGFVFFFLALAMLWPLLLLLQKSERSMRNVPGDSSNHAATSYVGG